MTARDTYIASVKTAAVTKAATDATNIMTAQVTIDASNTVVGYNLQTGNNANLLAAQRTAIAQLAINRAAAEQAKQAAITVARDVLKNTGDTAPA